MLRRDHDENEHKQGQQTEASKPGRQPCSGGIQSALREAYYKARGFTFKPHAPRCWCCSGMCSPDVTSSASLHSCVRPVLLGVEGEATVAASRSAATR